jgi:glycosyltransferase involved in cell wall biosynthesis
MNMPVLFSIVVPTYNRAHIIPVTIESILKQTYSNFEVIIVDDGSTDNTGEVVQKYLSHKIHYYKKSNGERAAARNFGTTHAKGHYVNWVDSDDVLFPDHLAGAARMVEKYNRPEIFSMGFQYAYAFGKIIHVSNFPVDVNGAMYKGNQFAMSAPMVRRDIALPNPFNEDRDLSGSEDYELWLRLASKYPIYTSKERTVSYMLHDERSTVNMADPAQLIKRYMKFIHCAFSEPMVVDLLGTHKKEFLMKNYLLLAVDLAIHNQKNLALKYVIKGFINSPKIIFEKGFYAFFKYCMKHLPS